jgi:hypothetical protein
VETSLFDAQSLVVDLQKVELQSSSHRLKLLRGCSEKKESAVQAVLDDSQPESASGSWLKRQPPFAFPHMHPPPPRHRRSRKIPIHPGGEVAILAERLMVTVTVTVKVTVMVTVMVKLVIVGLSVQSWHGRFVGLFVELFAGAGWHGSGDSMKIPRAT